jgi:hypothetical protein
LGSHSGQKSLQRSEGFTAVPRIGR